MTKDALNALNTMQELILRDLEDTPDEQLRAEIVEDGQDPDILDRDIAEGLDSVVADYMRSRVAAMKAVRKATALQTPKSRPSIETLKQLVQKAFESDSNLAAAYRQGTKQSERDWISAYDDLLLLGKIDPSEHG